MFENANTHVILTMFQDIIIALKIRAKTEGLAKIIQMNIRAVVARGTKENTAKVSVNIASVIFTMDYNCSGNINNKY